MARADGIYVETFIRGTIDDVWRKTQDPSLHERWDLRFSTIRYLPRDSPDSPQRFLYSTRIGAGLTVAGEGESTGEQLTDGARTSALKFWSDDRRSLIRRGSGYWQYLPRDGGVIFLTWYDYDTRFGALGSLVDRWLFRPALGWATAWSFDRLRLWMERNLDPAVAMQRSIVHAIARCTVAFVFVWHGIVPKLIYHHPDELLMLTDAGISERVARSLVTVAGVLEILLGAIIASLWSRTAPLAIAMGLMAAATVGVAATSPRYLIAAFNPVTLNLCVFALAWVALLTADDRPSAARCARSKADR